MLFKVFTVLSVIFLLGGLPNCQSCTADEDDVLVQMLKKLISSNTGADQISDNELHKSLIVLIQTLSNTVANKRNTDEGHELLEHLKELLIPLKKTPNHVKDLEIAFFLKMLPHIKGDLLKQCSTEIHKYMNELKNIHSIMVCIITNAKHDIQQKMIEMYKHYLNGDDDTSKHGDDDNEKEDHEAKEPMSCEKESCMKMEYEVKTSPLVKIMKMDGWRLLFEHERDHNKFTEMVNHIEESNGSMAWLNHLFMLVEKNEWFWKIGHRMLSMLEQKKETRDKLKHFVQDHKDLREIVMKASQWLKSRKFNMSSPTVQRIVRVLLKMGFVEHEESIGKRWFDSYMDWVDCNFGKHEEMATLMKTVGVMLKNEDEVEHVFGHIMDSPNRINVTLQLMFSGILRCNNTVVVVQQNLLDILHITVANKQFCTTNSFKVIERNSTGTLMMGSHIGQLGMTPNTRTNIWKIDIFEGSTLLHRDVDLLYIPMDGEIIYCNFTQE